MSNYYYLFQSNITQGFFIFWNNKIQNERYTIKDIPTKDLALYLYHRKALCGLTLQYIF